MDQTQTHWAVAIGALILVLVALYFVMTRQAASQVQSYDECIAAGYPSTLSYPATCQTQDGQIFIQQIK